MKNPYIDSVWDQIMAQHGHKKKVIRQTLIGRKITTNYEQGTTYTIEDILWDKNPKITILDPKKYFNQEMSYAQYFKREHGLEIKEMEQPMIVAYKFEHSYTAYVVHECSNSPILLVPEFCFATDVSNISKWILKFQMRIMKRFGPIV